MTPKSYPVFLSYNHQDRAFARWLHRGLESFKPHRSAGIGIDKSISLAPAFMDREELASQGDLGQAVQAALLASENLVVVCSPHAARSKWVNEEVKAFQRLGRADRIFCIVAHGDPSQLPQTAEDVGVGCFPIALLFDEQGHRLPEPLAADARPSADGKRAARLKIIAGLLGVPYDSLRQRELHRRQRVFAGIAVAASVGVVITSGLAITAWMARNEAQRQRAVAEQKTRTAQRTVEFLKTMFANADPSQARGESITAREVVDRAALQIDGALRGEPLVRAELMTTLGEVYTGLGLFRKSGPLLERARSLSPEGSVERAMLDAAEGDLKYYSGEYKAAVTHYEHAQTILNVRNLTNSVDAIKIQTSLGNALSGSGQYDRARDVLLQAEKITPQASQFDEVRAGLLFALGSNAYYAKDIANSKSYMERALEVRLKASGDFHPHVSWILNSLGVMAHDSGQHAAAEKLYASTLEIERKVFGESHLTVAGTRSNLARVVLEQRKFQDAANTLTQSIEVMTAQLAPDHDDLAFVYANLAIAQRGLDDDKAAEENFLKALPIARKHKHRTLAPTLTDLAEIECRTRRFDSAMQRLDEAEPLMKSTYPDEPWRAAYVEQIRGACLLTKGDLDGGRTLLARSTPVLIARWGEAGLFGYEAKLRLAKAAMARPARGPAKVKN
jgi:tetratricopeptide (TPR) repeat protein